MKKTCEKIGKRACQKNENFSVNDYVVVAYQDMWYPGCVMNTNKNYLTIKFMTPGRKPVIFTWRKFVLTT